MIYSVCCQDVKFIFWRKLHINLVVIYLSKKITETTCWVPWFPVRKKKIINFQNVGGLWITTRNLVASLRTLREGNGTPPQYSCLENPMDGGAWWAAVHGVSRSRTRLSDFTFTHWRRKWQPTPVFLPGESQGWGSLVGCRLWGRTESDTTKVT